MPLSTAHPGEGGCPGNRLLENVRSPLHEERQTEKGPKASAQKKSKIRDVSGGRSLESPTEGRLGHCRDLPGPIKQMTGTHCSRIISSQSPLSLLSEMSLD